jgi:hypothetical protein
MWAIFTIEKRTRASEYLQFLHWGILSTLVVHLLTHCALGPLAHLRFLSDAMPAYHASGKECTHPVADHTSSSSSRPHRSGLPGICDELVGAHKATVSTSSQTFDVSYLTHSLSFFDSRIVTAGAWFPSAASLLCCCTLSSLYLQHTALLI